MEKRIDCEKLDEYEKIFLVHKIFDVWGEEKIINDNILFLPSDVKIYNEKDISKIYLICSNMNKCDKVNDIVNKFINLDFYEKLDFMISIFEEINELTIVPNRITDTMDFKDLSNEIKNYKLT